MATKVRARLVWFPEWPGPVEVWSRKFCYNNKWRCDRVHGIDDLMQDAYLTFMKIIERYWEIYPGVTEDEFMALFKAAVRNQMHDRAAYVRRKRAVHQDTDQDVSELFTGRIGEVTNAGYLQALLNEAPEELKLALALLESDPKAFRPQKHRRMTPRENLNMRLRRLLGFDKMRLDAHTKFDLAKELAILLGTDLPTNHEELPNA